MNNIMPTQTSQLVSNLQTIYNTKLEIKAALGTNSDDFTEYPELIQAAISEGGGGSGSAKVDPWYGSTNIVDMVENEETSAYFYSSIISDNFSATAVEEGGEPTGAYEDISWDEIAEFEENGEPVEKIVHVVLTGDPHEQSGTAGAIMSYNDELDGELYNNIYPILENVTLTESSNPSEDGYDYLIEGDLYAWNLNTCDAGVDEITENGFYPEGGWFGVNVNVEGSVVDPYANATSIASMIENEETTADYVGSTIMSDFGTGGGNSSWSETVTIDTGELDQNDEPILEEKKVLVAVSIGGTGIATALTSYPDLYENIYPVIQDATLSVATGDDAEDGYDYVLQGDLYAWNLNDMDGAVEEITENGFYPSADSVPLGFNVNVEGSGGGLEEGAFYIFNFLEMSGGNHAKIIMDNKPYEELCIFNLDPINYIDPTTGQATHNAYFGFRFFDDSKSEEVIFESMTDPSSYSQSSCFVRFTGLDADTETNVFDTVRIDETGWENNSWTQGNSYFATLSDSYEVTADDEVVVNFHMLQSNHVVDVFINGILVEENVVAILD